MFIREPEFQGQTKDKLATLEAMRIVENAVRDHFDHWLTGHPAQADRLLNFIIDRAEERIRRRQEKEVGRKTAVRKLRLPGKLADCSANQTQGSELFIVEGDSAGGSAKQARNRETQAVLPLRGKILNVASAPPRTSWPATSNWPIWCRPWGRAPARPIARTICATTRSSS